MQSKAFIDSLIDLDEAFDTLKQQGISRNDIYREAFSDGSKSRSVGNTVNKLLSLWEQDQPQFEKQANATTAAMRENIVMVLDQALKRDDRRLPLDFRRLELPRYYIVNPTKYKIRCQQLQTNNGNLAQSLLREFLSADGINRQVQIVGENLVSFLIIMAATEAFGNKPSSYYHRLCICLQQALLEFRSKEVKDVINCRVARDQVSHNQAAMLRLNGATEPSIELEEEVAASRDPLRAAESLGILAKLFAAAGDFDLAHAQLKRSSNSIEESAQTPYFKSYARFNVEVNRLHLELSKGQSTSDSTLQTEEHLEQFNRIEQMFLNSNVKIATEAGPFAVEHMHALLGSSALRLITKTAAPSWMCTADARERVSLIKRYWLRPDRFAKVQSLNATKLFLSDAETKTLETMIANSPGPRET
jgi:hypothetical protein